MFEGDWAVVWLILSVIAAVIALIAHSIKIWQNTPLAIDYFYMPPQRQLVPDTALKKGYQNQDFWLSIVGIRNFSSKALSSIRIALCTDPMHDPVLIPSSVRVDPKYVKAVREVQVPKMDPDEGLYVWIFLSSQEEKRFTEPQVIVNHRRLSRGMRMVGFFKKYPGHALPILASWFSILLASVFAAYMVFKPVDPKVKAVQEFIAANKQNGCVVTPYERLKVNESLLAKHKLGEEWLLDKNSVATLDELKKKEVVLICEER